MQLSGIPVKFSLSWGASAGGGYIRNIPVASQIGITDGAASLTDGFPPLNFSPVGSGGVPPFGQDMNGIFRQITQWSQWYNAGGPIVYDSAFQAAVDGYPNGAVVASAVTAGLWWLSTVDNNVTNPDTGGAGWRRYTTSGGLISKRVFNNSGTYTPTVGTNSVVVTVIGAGGGGGGAAAMSVSQWGAGGGGGSGGWAQSALATGFSGVAITIGAAGAGIGGSSGSNGGTTSFGALISIGGGIGGAAATANAFSTTSIGGAGGTPTGGNLYSSVGAAGASSVALASTNMVSGAGGATPFGSGGRALPGSGGNGIAAGGPGGGGGGSSGSNSAAQTAGGAGAKGMIIIEEYG